MSTSSVTYDDVAPEYYDPDRHPTSGNFRQLSIRLISTWLPHIGESYGWSCDVGAGKSVLAELFMAARVPLDRLLLLDASLAMLAHSKPWEAHGARLLCGDATLIPFRDHTFRLLVASLGDPYNTAQFWAETRRVLRPGGSIIFTTPSSSWSERYRARMKQDRQKAEFDVRDRGRVYVPSVIYSESDQVAMIQSAGLMVKDVAGLPLSTLRSGRISWKLRDVIAGTDNAIVGYLALNGC